MTRIYVLATLVVLGSLAGCAMHRETPSHSQVIDEPSGLRLEIESVAFLRSVNPNSGETNASLKLKGQVLGSPEAPPHIVTAMRVVSVVDRRGREYVDERQSSDGARQQLRSSAAQSTVSFSSSTQLLDIPSKIAALQVEVEYLLADVIHAGELEAIVAAGMTPLSPWVSARVAALPDSRLGSYLIQFSPTDRPMRSWERHEPPIYLEAIAMDRSGHPIAKTVTSSLEWYFPERPLERHVGRVEDPSQVDRIVVRYTDAMDYRRANFVITNLRSVDAD